METAQKLYGNCMEIAARFCWEQRLGASIKTIEMIQTIVGSKDWEARLRQLK